MKSVEQSVEYGVVSPDEKEVEVVADNNCNINVNTPACFYRELVDIRQLTELFAQYRP